MKATIVTMTKELAKDYLGRNLENRKINPSTLLFYKNQMLNNKWKENGEPIIIDVNGVIKDGQHRLMAVLETGYEFRVPVISGVSPYCMDTIDTGRNRTAADVLYLEGFKYSSLVASLVKVILSDRLTFSSTENTKISNSDILEYSIKNKSYIYELIDSVKDISSLQVARVLTDTIIGFYLHKYGNDFKTKDFLNNIIGLKRNPRSATDYVYKKLYKSYSGEERISLGDKQKYIERAYEYYMNGNPKVKSIKINYNKKKQLIEETH
jgi:hypothetical protein